MQLLISNFFRFVNKQRYSSTLGHPPLFTFFWEHFLPTQDLWALPQETVEYVGKRRKVNFTLDDLHKSDSDGQDPDYH